MTLRFSAGQGFISVYREATSYTFQDTSFHKRNKETVLRIPDAGWYGSSTITFDFILAPFDAERLSLIAELSMHKTAPLQLTSQRAKVDIDAAIPKVSFD